MALRDMFKKSYRDLGPEEALALVETGAVLLDVRESQEWQAGHAPKARHLPLSQLANRAGELPKNRQILVICRSGNRSAHAAKMLATPEREVINVKGGMSAWARHGYPVVAKGGGPGRVV